MLTIRFNMPVHKHLHLAYGFERHIAIAAATGVWLVT